jgi:CelD/BcsL family acetyltransferase involved in cellulose biosynthesis
MPVSLEDIILVKCWISEIRWGISEAQHGKAQPDGDFMQIEIIKTREHFNTLGNEWNQLLMHSASHVPFLRHEYLSTWWSTLGGGEWSHGDLCLVAARHTNGVLCGIAPLFFTKNLEGEAALMFLGSIEISDYLDVICRQENMEPFITAALDHLLEADVPDWQVLDLYNILEDSPTLPVLEAEAKRRGLEYNQEKNYHCPYISLPGDWETYLAGIDKKQRHEIRRKIRRAENADLPVRWYIVDEESSLENEIEAFLGLMAQDSDKQAFLTDAMRTQMDKAVRAAFREGWLQLAFLEVGGEKAAGYLNFDYRNHIWVYNSGIDYQFSAYSPGWVLLGYLLEWANQQQRQAFDFMRGDEDYKYRFGATDRFVVRAQVRRPLE